MSSLTDKQELFCIEYIKDFNATQAAIRSGYSKSSGRQIASDNLSKHNIQERIAELMNERIVEVKTDANFVLKRLLDIDSLDIADIVNESGDLLPVKDWPKVWRTSVNAIEIVQMKSTEDVIAYLKKIKIPDKIKNLELLGKHIDVSAFKERLELTGKDGKELVVNVVSNKTKDGINKLKDSLS